MRRLIIQSGDDAFARYMELSRPVHAEYARRCGADYRYFHGCCPDGRHPAWNRIRLMLDAFAEGYDKLLWLDCDVLVTALDANIFAATDDMTPVHIPWSPSGMVWRPGWWALCSGVMLANNTPAAVECLEYVWAERWRGTPGHPPLAPHHHAPLWESNALLDWLYDHPGAWAKLSQVWNWKVGNFERVPECEALIYGFHGGPHDQRWADFRATFARVYGAPPFVAGGAS